jgi:hypothetical protein
MVPCVVSAVKSGAVSPSRSAMVFSFEGDYFTAHDNARFHNPDQLGRDYGKAGI